MGDPSQHRIAIASFYASVATALGFLIGAFGIAVALLTYLASLNASRSAHMHGLFRDFLKVEIEVGDDDHLTKLPSQGLGSDPLSFRLYTLEEMHAWLGAQRRWDRWALFERKRRRDSAKGWERTIASHIRDCHIPIFVHMNRYADCYSEGFLKFTAATLSDDIDLGGLIEDELEQRRRTRRPGQRRYPYRATANRLNE